MTLRFFKTLIAVFLILAVTIESTGKGGIFISYLLNKKYIAENLCENKSNSKLHCNGKCYLLKQLKQQDDNEQIPTAPSSASHDEEIIMDLPNRSLNDITIAYTVTEKLFAPCSKYISRNHTDIFHPPA